MIEFKQVTKEYENLRAVDSLNLQVKEGELLVFIGPSGCGKTTTMKMINRLIEPTAGEIMINGKSIADQSPVSLRRDIGYVIQHIGLLPHMSIADNVAIVPRLKKLDVNKYMKRVDELLEMVGLDPNVYRDRYPNELSGGQQQRVGVIRALAADPPIILMDEPFSALDPISREQLQEELVRLQEEINKTIVFVTHDMDEALKIADRICLMKDGKVVQLDTPENMVRHPANDFVRSFIGEDRLDVAATLPDIAELMVKPATSRPHRGLAEAAQVMRRQRVNSLLVVDKDNRLLGVTRMRDITLRYQEEQLTLQEVMDTKVPRIDLNDTLVDAIEKVREHNIAYLPVVNGEGKLQGVITSASLIDAMTDRYINGS